jgi:hypothetical protein
MHESKMVRKEFLSDGTYEVDVACVIQNFFWATAITHLIEVAAPQVFSILTNCPSTCHSFTHKRVEVLFSLSASLGAKREGAETSAGHQCIENVVIAFG